MLRCKGSELLVEGAPGFDGEVEPHDAAAFGGFWERETHNVTELLISGATVSRTHDPGKTAASPTF